MSTAPAETAAAAPARKGGVLKLIGVAVIAAGLAGGGAVFFMGKKATAKPVAEEGTAGEEHAAADEHGEAKAEEHGDAHGAAKGAGAGDFALLSPQFVVNLSDEDAMRFLQVEVQVIARKNAAMEAVKLNDPLVRNRLMLLFGSQSYTGLLKREGKEKLQADAATEINKVLDEQKKPQIDGVVFTNLVMQ